jgi:hypothetical protein
LGNSRHPVLPSTASPKALRSPFGDGFKAIEQYSESDAPQQWALQSPVLRQLRPYRIRLATKAIQPSRNEGKITPRTSLKMTLEIPFICLIAHAQCQAAPAGGLRHSCERCIIRGGLRHSCGCCIICGGLRQGGRCHKGDPKHRCCARDQDCPGGHAGENGTG